MVHFFEMKNQMSACLTNIMTIITRIQETIIVKRKDIIRSMIG